MQPIGLRNLPKHLQAGFQFWRNSILSYCAHGTYGICEESGEAIPAARLKAVPWTRFTREVEERLEKKGFLPGPCVRKAGTVRTRGHAWLAPDDEADEME